MLLTKKGKSKSQAARHRRPKQPAREPFWARAGHPDMDRAGDLLLRELTAIRSESHCRGPSA
jgi:hypothetical protein